jgi:hypothetical protein
VTFTHTLAAWLLLRRPPLWRQIAVYAAFALGAASVSITLAFFLVLALRGQPDLLSRGGPDLTVSGILGTAVFAPAAETLLLAALLSLLRIASANRLFVAAMAGLFWGACHVWLGAFSFFGSAPAFFVFSCAYMAWREVSFGRAFLAAATPHALINSLALVLAAVT